MRVRISVKDPTWRNTNNIVDIRYNDLVNIHPLFSRPFQFYNWHQHLTRTTASSLSIQVHTYFTSGALGCKKNWVAMHSRTMIPLINFVVARMKEKKNKPSLLREPKIVWSRLSAVSNLWLWSIPRSRTETWSGNGNARNDHTYAGCRYWFFFIASSSYMFRKCILVMKFVRSISRILGIWKNLDFLLG